MVGKLWLGHQRYVEEVIKRFGLPLKEACWSKTSDHATVLHISITRSNSLLLEVGEITVKILAF